MYIVNNTLENLDNIISDMALNKGQFVKNPDVDFIRNRKLNFEDTIKFILGMNGNTLNKELYDYFGKDPEKIATSSAFVQQRGKLNDNVFEHLFNAFNETMTDYKTFNGYRLLAVDGSDINVAYDKAAKTYISAGRTRKNGADGKGYNQIHLNAIYDLINKVYINVYSQPKSLFNERKALIEMLKNMPLSDKTLFIADRGYPSWNVFTHFKYKENADYLIRVKNNGNNLIKDLPISEFDIDRELTITTNTSYKNTKDYVYVHVKKNVMKNREYTGGTAFVEWDFKMFEKLNFRIVRFKISEDNYETIFTSLPRDKFSIEDIKKFYGMRWGIETSFRELKYCIGLTNLHCKREDFVIQEIYARLTMYNFTHRIVENVIIKQDNNRKYIYKVNFTMATRFCTDLFKAMIGETDFYDLVQKYITPIRPGRMDKRKMKSKTFVCFAYRVA